MNPEDKARLQGFGFAVGGTLGWVSNAEAAEIPVGDIKDHVEDPTEETEGMT